MDKIVILAAGKGTRMGGDLPKVLVDIYGKPMISYLLDSVLKSNIDERPVIVVSPDNEAIMKNHLYGYDCQYAVQDKQMGTGHAVKCAKDKVSGFENVIVLYGDHPLIKTDTLVKLILEHKKKKSKITIMTLQLPDFNYWRRIFHKWGRIIRENNKIKKIIEFKDATAKQKAITEVNPALYCFDQIWLFQNLDRLRNENIQKEFYLTDMAGLAVSQNIEVNDVQICGEETIGVNTPEELEIAKKFFK